MKKDKFVIFMLILTIIMAIIFIFTLTEYIIVSKDYKSNNNSSIIEKTKSDNKKSEVITVDDDSSIRIITEYDENMFKGHKSILFFWASWCSHCIDEFDVLQNAIYNYQNNGYKIYLISHDYELSKLKEFMINNDLNYEVWFDEKRIIRKNIDPEASSVPLTYILNEDGNLIDSFDGAISQESLDNLIEKNMK